MASEGHSWAWVFRAISAEWFSDGLNDSRQTCRTERVRARLTSRELGALTGIVWTSLFALLLQLLQKVRFIQQCPTRRQVPDKTSVPPLLTSYPLLASPVLCCRVEAGHTFGEQ